jgi:DNA-binding GntR family transcriptional regulator
MKVFTQSSEDERPLDLGRVSTVDALVIQLRRLILTGELRPGDQLKEVQIAAAFGVGRHTLRAALQRLVQEGLLQHAAHRGHFVPQLSESDVADLFLLRAAIESEAAAVAASRKRDLTDVASALDCLEAITPEQSWDEVVEYDLNFHRAVVGIAGSPRLSRAFDMLHPELQLLNAQVQSVFSNRADLGKQHRLLLRAITTGDPEKARAAVRQHLSQGMRQFKKASGTSSELSRQPSQKS